MKQVSKAAISYLGSTYHPKALKQAAVSINFDNVSYFDVKLVDDLNNDLSIQRRYYYDNIPCHLTPLNVIFVNQFGVLDTVQFYNPINSLSVSRQTMKRNPYVNTAGTPSDYNDHIFNVIDEILTTNPKQQTKVSTGILDDRTLTWLSNILISEQIVLQVHQDLYIPILLSDNNYEIIEQKYQTEPNVKQFTFTLSEGFTPDFIFNNGSDTSSTANIVWSTTRTSNDYSIGTDGRTLTMTSDFDSWSSARTRQRVNVNSGKRYFEIQWISGTGQLYIGLGQTSYTSTLTATTTGWMIGSDGKRFDHVIAPLGTVWGSGSNTFAPGDVIGILINTNTGSFTAYKNCVLMGTPFASGIASNTEIMVNIYQPGGVIKLNGNKETWVYPQASDVNSI